MNPYLAQALKEQAEKRTTQVAQSSPEGYDAVTYDDLRSEISRRNEGRAEGDVIAPSGTKKSDLIKALEADDTTQNEEN